jgi:hypothetical protein
MDTIRTKRKGGNALRHGLLQKKIHLMQGESRYLYRKLNRSLFDHWRPENLAEQVLVQELVYNHWRLRRAYKLEGEFLEQAQTQADRHNVFSIETLRMQDFDRFTRYIVSIQRQILRILHELEKLQASRTSQNMATSRVLDVDINPNYN